MPDYLKGNKIFVPDFPMAGAGAVSNISDIKCRRFRIIDRYQGPWVMIYGDILKRNYKVKVISVEGVIYHIDVGGVNFALKPRKL